MSSGEVRKVSRQDIQLVQNLIERCLQLYMNQKEVVDTLLYQAKIEPGFTELVWLKLEEENREFFKAYHVRLLLKNQIIVFNKLLEKQVELMQKVCPPPLSNGSTSSALQQTPPCYLPEHVSTSQYDPMFCNGASSNAMMNGTSSSNQSIHLRDDASILNGRPNGIHGTTIKSERNYSNNSGFPFGTENTFLEPGAAFSSSELLEMDSSSLGFLSQIPRNFSFSDLTDDFTQSADILENYGRSPFLAIQRK
ncbi:uncharacterized protein A4U43_C07F38460 [Asparagus officinalis]|uniref:Angiotensin-converting enzyme 2 n=1 Tax=Asparagus officinalis TaxID=4686 RepID=A0A5P1ELZ9_ASPOF|nr:uncharacterized protein LOC109851104 isoform X2 [Asparagus officinalis]ONK65571.1 uncharacterized protein A4U43_C07F38460 [Asparagus officinalis]